ncbi:hypothetical protein [Stenotrophomonas sp.]|uniref:hypothetical protein n=1 Tax=Stenotrophomonas sp. TaxID=69392 RepID=UPI002FC5FEBE
MKTLHQSALALALIGGLVATAQAAPYSCAYTVTTGEQAGASGLHPVDANDQGDALTQASAWIYQTYGPVGFQLRCHAQ